jgi:DNA end-binding protein Ku
MAKHARRRDAATGRKNELSFRLLHATDESPIDYKRFCEEEAVEVPWREIAKGYELSKGRYVIVSEEDFEKARVKATQTFEIRDVVPADSIDDLYFEHPYYLAPAGPAAAKPYALLRDALEKSGRIGVGTIVMRQREHLASVAPSGEALVLTTMRWAYEIRPATALGLPGRTTSHDRRELDLALRLIDTLGVRPSNHF